MGNLYDVVSSGDYPVSRLSNYTPRVARAVSESAIDFSPCALIASTKSPRTDNRYRAHRRSQLASELSPSVSGRKFGGNAKQRLAGECVFDAHV